MSEFRGRRWSRRDAGIGHIALDWSSVADGVLAGLIVVMGLIGLSSLAGIEAAGETIRDRRRRRALKAAILADHGPVWANHAARRTGQYARGTGEP